MKRLSLAMAAVLALLSIAGCAQDYYGKGKAPPPPVFTKG
jgi:predicted small lipoprotein YifL